MGFKMENNTSYGKLPELEFSGNEGPVIPLIGRIFIDIGIVIGTIVAGVATAGTAIPAGLIGSGVGLATNTTIDVGEGRTDALTLGLDIGLPFATEALGFGIGQAIKNLPISEARAIKIMTKTLEKTSIKTGSGHEGLINSIKNYPLPINNWTRKSVANYLKEFTYTPKNISEAVKGSVDKVSILKDAKIRNTAIDKSIKNIENSVRSITDVLDKVTGTVRDILAKLLPRLTKFLKQLKQYYRSLVESVGKVINPVKAIYDKVSKQAKILIQKNPTIKESLEKMKLKQIYFKDKLLKQSQLSNAILSKFDLTPVQSTWLLGYKVFIKDSDDDGNILSADLIWFFIPETTRHNGSRGATPEPMGKRPVVIRDLTQSELEAYTNQDSFGRFYLTNIGDRIGNTSLFNAEAGDSITVDDLQSNMVNLLMNNALSIIPGYSIVTEIGRGIKTFETLGTSIISGTYGTQLAKDITNWRSAVHSLTGPLVNTTYRHISNLIQRPEDISTGTANALLKSSLNVRDKVPKINYNIVKNGNV